MQAVKPNDIIYGVSEKPPFFKTVLLALQQVVMASLYLVLIVVVAQKAGLPNAIAQNMISLTFIAMGIGVLAQALFLRFLGSGYLIGSCVAPTFLVPALTAISVGGIALMAGMMLFTGVIEALFALISKQLRFLFPKVVTGLIFCFIAISVAYISLEKVFGPGVQLHSTHFELGFLCFSLTLIIIICLNIWAKGTPKFLCLMIGLAIGCVVAYFLGLFTPHHLTQLKDAAAFKLPSFSHLHYAFSVALVPIFLVAALAAGLRSIGVVTTAQRINDANWKRPNMKSLRGGIIADALSVFVSGALNTVGTGTSPSTVGITKATGATSRIIGVAAAILCFLFALLPKISALFLALPLTVVAAGLLFASCLMFSGGLRIITAEEINPRRTLIIGLSLFLAISPELFPAFFHQLPKGVQSITNSMMVMGTLTAIILNLILRIGIKKRLTITLGKEDHVKSLSDLKTQLNQWHVDATQRDELNEALTTLQRKITEANSPNVPINIHITHDEVMLTVQIKYHGRMPEFDDLPSVHEDDNLVDENTFITGLRSLYHDAIPEKLSINQKEGHVIIKQQFAI